MIRLAAYFIALASASTAYDPMNPGEYLDQIDVKAYL